MGTVQFGHDARLFDEVAMTEEVCPGHEKFRAKRRDYRRMEGRSANMTQAKP